MTINIDSCDGIRNYGGIPVLGVLPDSVIYDV